MATYCILSGIYPPDTGGPAKFAKTFAEFLENRGHKVKIISYTDFKSRRIKTKNIEIFLISRKFPVVIRYLICVIYILGSVTHHEKIVANGCFIEIALARLFFPFKYVSKIPGDIVWEKARNNGLTTLSIDDFQNLQLNLKYRIFKKLFHLSVRKSQKVIVPSTHLKVLVTSWNVPSTNIQTIFNSVDTKKFIANMNSHPKFDVITVSRLVPWKGLDQVVKICAKLNLRLGVVGDGPIRGDLEQLAQELSSNVTFFGNIDQEMLVGTFQKAKFFVLNSSFEATSYALLEAMSCGLVPISSDETGSAEVIEHLISGILIGESTGFSLESALNYLLNKPEEVDKMSKTAVQVVQGNFDIQKNFERIRVLVSE